MIGIENMAHTLIGAHDVPAPRYGTINSRMSDVPNKRIKWNWYEVPFLKPTFIKQWLHKDNMILTTD